MKIYKSPEPPTLMRINIKQANEKTQHIAVEDAGLKELHEWLKALIEKQGLSIFESGKITTVEVRESIEGINGKIMSFHFKGLKPAQVHELILNNLK